MAVSKELKIRLPEAFFSALQELAERSGISMSAVMVSLLSEKINGPGSGSIRVHLDPDPGRPRSGADPGQERPRSDPDPAPEKGDIGGKDFPPVETKKQKERKPPSAEIDPRLVEMRDIFPAGYKGDLEACKRHAKRVADAEWPAVIAGARAHIETTPIEELKFAEADVFLRKQLWGRYPSISPAAPPPPRVKPVIRDMVHLAELTQEAILAHRDVDWEGHANGWKMQQYQREHQPEWRAACETVQARTKTPA